MSRRGNTADETSAVSRARPVFSRSLWLAMGPGKKVCVANQFEAEPTKRASANFEVVESIRFGAKLLQHVALFADGDDDDDYDYHYNYYYYHH